MLHLVVFLCGAAVMVLELVGSRVVAPYLGTSVVVWTGLIGVVLAALSLGYWWGGRLADRRPSPRLLAGIILAAAVCMALVAATRTMILQQLAQAQAHPSLASLLANLLLFAPASLLLGMVAPYAVRLSLLQVDSAGRIAGRLYAVSTLGSIAGTFLTGFVLLAWLGNAAILLATAAVLVVASLLASRRDLLLKLAVLALLGLMAYGLERFDESMAALGVHDVDTAYARVVIYEGRTADTGRPVRAMLTGPHGVQSAMYPDAPQDLALEYTRFFSLAAGWAPQARAALVLGGGACSFPTWLARSRPELRLDVVELDPGITALAQSHFALPNPPPFRLFHEDARTYLNGCATSYDLIFLDVFAAHYVVPFHLASLEALGHMNRLLADQGVLVVNAIGFLEGPRSALVRSLAATVRRVFPQVTAYALGRDGSDARNIMLVASRHPLPPLQPSDPELATLLAQPTPILPNLGPVLTDDHAPVEFLALALR